MSEIQGLREQIFANATILFPDIAAIYQAQNATNIIRASDIFEIIIRCPGDDKDRYSAVLLYVSEDGEQHPVAIGTFSESIEAALYCLLRLVITAMWNGQDKGSVAGWWYKPERESADGNVFGERNDLVSEGEGVVNSNSMRIFE